MRIVSLLPSTTEILFGIGAGADVVGVTFECDYPPQARTRRIVSTSAVPAGLSPREIDAHVTKALAAGEDLYHLDAGALADLDAALVVTQDLCAVCAVDVSVVDDALAYLGCRAEVLTIDPHTLEEVLQSVPKLGDATGHQPAAAAAVAGLRQRLYAVGLAVAGRTPPRALLLEWSDPPFTPGHWVPDMVEAAGGTNALGRAGAKSERTTWAEVSAAEPEVLIVAPCGYGLEDSVSLAQKAIDAGRLPPGIPVWAVDSNASFARPGLRLVDGVEALAHIFHPGAFGDLPPRSRDALARRLR
jgi:iron complex transport system substrate-binding protein